jgi:hypothetical protein
MQGSKGSICTKVDHHVENAKLLVVSGKASPLTESPPTSRLRNRLLERKSSGRSGLGSVVLSCGVSGLRMEIVTIDSRTRDNVM